MIGREAEIEQLEAVIASVANGAKRAVLLTGPAGIGKTTLLRWAYDRAGEAGMLRGFARAPSAAGLPPRFPIGELMTDLARALEEAGHAIPLPMQRILAAVETGSPYSLDAPQVARALDSLGSSGPIALFLDDCHWAPAEAMQHLLAALRVAATPLLFATSVRTESPTGETDCIDSTGDLWFASIALVPLTASGIAALAPCALDGPALPSLVSTVATWTAGNPLFALETFRSLREQKLVRRFGSYWGFHPTGSPKPPLSLAHAAAARIHHLPSAARTVMDALAVLGRPATLRELEHIMTSPADVTADALELLHARGLVVEARHNTFKIAHPIYDAAVYDALSPVRRAVLHSAVYEALASGDTSAHATELAHHACRADQPPACLSSLVEKAATDAAAVGANHQAAYWYDQLASHHPPGSDEWRAARRRLAAVVVAFDPHRAVDIYSALLATCLLDDERRQLYVDRSYAHRVLGRFDASAADLEAAAHGASHAEMVDIRHRTAVLAGIRGNIDEAEHTLQELADLDLPDSVRSRVLGHLGHVAFVRDRIVETCDLWHRSLLVATEPQTVAYTRANLVWALVLKGDWSRASMLLDEGLESADATGDNWTTNTLLCSGARLAAWRGDEASALDYARRALISCSADSNPAYRATALDTLIVALTAAGEVDEATSYFNEAHSLLSDTELEPRDWVVMCCSIAETYVSLHDVSGASSFLALARAHSTRGGPRRPSFIEYVEAALLLEQGCIDDAAILLERSLSSSVTSLIPFQHARLLRLAAAAAETQRDRTARLSRLREAARLFAQLGASRLEQDVRDSLKRAAQPRGRPRSTLPFGLTARELEVLRLICAGLTDQQIAERLTLSWRTVRKHVENVMRKLHATRRAQLVSVALRAGVAPAEAVVTSSPLY